MEHDRYLINRKLFIIALISMILSLAFFAMTLFLIPNLIFGVTYDTPEFIMFWREWLQFNYGYFPATTAKIIILFFFALSVFFAIIAYFTSNRLEGAIYADELPSRKKVVKPRRMSDEGMMLALKIFFIILLVVMCAVLLSWFLSTPTIRNNTGMNTIISQ